LESLEENGASICYTIDELIELLDEQVINTNDDGAYEWWRNQKISSAGVPSQVVPTDWTIPQFSLWGTISLPEKSLEVGPAYISGDCLNYGESLRIPWLFVIALAGVLVNFGDMWVKYHDTTIQRAAIDWIWLLALCICNLAPFLAFNLLFETRINVPASLRPLLASRALHRGVKVAVMGDRSHKMVIGLRKFLKKLGHLHEGHVQLTTSHLIKIVVLTSFDARDNTFGESAPKLDKFTIVIWALNEDGFGVDPTTQRKLNRIEQMKTLDTKPKELMEKIAIKQADLAKHNKRSHDYKETEKDLKKLENELSDYTELKRDVEFCNNGVKPLLPGQTEVHKTRKQKKTRRRRMEKTQKTVCRIEIRKYSQETLI